MKNITCLIRVFCYYIPILRPLLGCPMELSIIRHAQSLRNALTNGWRYSGPPEQRELLNFPDHKVDITKEGFEQSKKSGPGITAAITPDIIITSGYARTDQTLAGIKEGSDSWKDIPVKKDLLIRERENGYTWCQLDIPHHEFFPFLNPYWEQLGPFFARPVGGESILDLIEKRIHRFLDKIRRKYSGKKICLVTHGRVLTGIRAVLEDLSVEEVEKILKSKTDSPANVGLTVYRYSPWSGRLELVFYNKTFY